MRSRFGMAFSEKEIVWVCLTSMHHRRFVEDLIHAVGMPMGAIVRLRYRKSYVAPQLWGLVSNGCSSAAKVLLALGGTDTAGKSEVTPLRRGSVIAAKVYGSVLVVDVALEDFVNESVQSGRLYSELKLIGKSVPSEFGGTNSAGHYLQCLEKPLTGLSASKSVDSWERVVESFWRIDELVGGKKKTGVPFLYYICPSHKRRVCISKDGSLALEMSKTYFLDVHTAARSGGEGFKNALGEVVFEFSNSAASFVSSRRVRIDSRRDIKTIGITTAPIFRGEKGHMSVRTIGFDYKKDDGHSDVALANDVVSSSKDRKEIVVARYDFPVGVGRIYPYIASAALSIAAGAAVFKLGASGGVELKDLYSPLLVTAMSFVALIVGLKKQ